MNGATVCGLPTDGSPIVIKKFCNSLFELILPREQENVLEDFVQMKKHAFRSRLQKVSFGRGRISKQGYAFANGMSDENLSPNCGVWSAIIKFQPNGNPVDRFSANVIVATFPLQITLEGSFMNLFNNQLCVFEIVQASSSANCVLCN
jgi:hypothetical protein